VRIPPALVALLWLWGWAGHWVEVTEPGGSVIRDEYPRDFRVVLQNDSVVTLRDAIVRDDSLVETGGGAPCGVALADVVRLEQWQSRGERVTGGVALALFGSLALLLWLVGRAVSGSGS